MPRGSASTSIMSMPAVAACSSFSRGACGVVGAPDVADDDLGLGQRRDQPLHVVEPRRGRLGSSSVSRHLVARMRGATRAARPPRNKVFMCT
jgi:hypothetical protein